MLIGGLISVQSGSDNLVCVHMDISEYVISKGHAAART